MTYDHLQTINVENIRPSDEIRTRKSYSLRGILSPLPVPARLRSDIVSI